MQMPENFPGFFGWSCCLRGGQAGKDSSPSALREFAGIEKDAVLVGVGSRIEIWAKDRWIEANSYDNMEEIAESMEELGI